MLYSKENKDITAKNNFRNLKGHVKFGAKFPFFKGGGHLPSSYLNFILD
jgi:hypothetical protein